MKPTMFYDIISKEDIFIWGKDIDDIKEKLKEIYYEIYYLIIYDEDLVYDESRDYGYIIDYTYR
jgi:hypothetical protein